MIILYASIVNIATVGIAPKDIIPLRAVKIGA
jgi:hypothetical protein